MRSLIYLLIALFAFTHLSCDNDLDLISEKRDIPVVYGLLSLSEENQLIRIERAFIDETISGTQLAQVADSLYYPNLDVRLVSENGEYVFERIDGNEEGYPREDGLFATSPNVLYRGITEDMNLVAEQEYTLQINRGNDLPLVEATTFLIDAPRIITPTNTGRLDFDDVDDFKVTWRPSQPGLFDVVMKLNIFEFNADPEIRDRDITLSWVVARNVEARNIDEGEVERNGQGFYQFLEQNLDKDERITRAFKNIDLQIIGGGQELLEYIKVGQANLGITSSQEIPTYTNLSEGYGVFSSKAVAIREGVTLSSGTQDSLRFGRYTKDLNFR